MLIATATVSVSCMLPSDTTLLLLSQVIATLLCSCTLGSGTIPCIVLVAVLYGFELYVAHAFCCLWCGEALILMAIITKIPDVCWHADVAATFLLLCMAGCHCWPGAALRAEILRFLFLAMQAECCLHACCCCAHRIS